jgi:hypothetical protein
MSARVFVAGLVVLGALGLASACKFDPDLSRYKECAEDGTCAPGYTCLVEEQLCLPDCGSQCTPEPADAGTDGGKGDGGASDGGTSDGGPGDSGRDGGSSMDAGADAGEPLSLVTAGLPPATETMAYAETLRAQGGKPPYLFRPTEPLPQGFVLDGGVLSGTPATPGTFRVAVEVLDQGSPPSTVGTAYDLRVRPLLRVAGPEILVNGYLNNTYAEQVSVTGGTPPYLYSLASGNQPPSGLTFETDGGVKGTPSSSGQYALQVRVTDSDPQPQMVGRQLELNVTSSPLLLDWATQSIPDGRVGTPYRYVLKVAGASSATWKLEAGTTPPGIGFDALKATLLGNPTDPGVYSFTISAASGLSKVERTFTLTVY